MIGACATTPPVDVQPNMEAWELRKNRLTDLAMWQIDGRVAILHANEGWHASMYWSQRESRYNVYISGPFGQGGARLDGDEQLVTLTLPDREPVQSRDPGMLLYAELGWRIPVQSLRYWLLGLPRPGEHGAISIDESGKISQLEQDGWVIEYDRYTVFDDLELPKKLVLQHRDWRVKLIVDAWSIMGGDNLSADDKPTS